MAVYRLRKVLPQYDGRVRIVFRALSLELKNLQSTPKDIVDQEIVLMTRQEPDLPINAWYRHEWRYVPTLLPAFEAEKAALEQGIDASWEFGWRVRHAFFAKSKTICMRWVLGDIARDAGLDVDRFLADWDSGRFRRVVEEESRRGWDDLSVRGSPTFVLPSGRQIWNPGAGEVRWNRHHEMTAYTPPDCPNGDCLAPVRNMIEETLRGEMM